MTAALVWKPLEVDGLRLYCVTVLHSLGTPDQCVVLSTSPSEAARVVERIYKPRDGWPKITGHEVNVLQPGETT
jgi:hypothetical protein